MRWQDILIKLVPILPTLLMYWASYNLSHEKQRKDQEESRENRLNKENEDLMRKLENERDAHMKAQEEIIKLRSKIARLESKVDTLKELLDERKDKK